MPDVSPEGRLTLNRGSEEPVMPVHDDVLVRSRCADQDDRLQVLAGLEPVAELALELGDPAGLAGRSP